MATSWSGTLQFALLSVPVKLYRHAREQGGLGRMACPECHGGMRVRDVCESCGKEWPRTATGRNVESDGGLVYISKEQIEQLPKTSSRTVQIRGFARKSELRATIVQSAYLAAPDMGKGKSKIIPTAYAAMVDALASTEQIAVGSISFRDRERPCAIVSDGSILTCYVLYRPAEIKELPEVPELPETDGEILEMTTDLFNTAPLKVADYLMGFVDTYEEGLIKLVETGIVEKPAEVTEAPPDLLAALQASLAEK